MISQICLDVDGVLADWPGAVIALFEQDPDEVYDNWSVGQDIIQPMGISLNQLWRRVDAAGPAFWANLEPYPWAVDLYEFCKQTAPTVIATSPSQHPSSLVGKLAFLENLFGRPFRDYLMGPNKYFLARDGAVLIDDNDDNCIKFVANLIQLSSLSLRFLWRLRTTGRKSWLSQPISD